MLWNLLQSKQNKNKIQVKSLNIEFEMVESREESKIQTVEEAIAKVKADAIVQRQKEQ